MYLPCSENIYTAFDSLWNLVSSKIYGHSQVGAPEEAVPVVEVFVNKPPPLYALLIGINQYTSAGVRDLKGAVPDAQAMKSYLETSLGVPTSQIKTLYDEKATRESIIASLRDLKQDPRINRGDPILIYYAGHGSAADAPAGWETEGNEIQLLISHDALCESGGKMVAGIPDRTIGVLLEQIAQEKDDNITVIFDCCHSGSITREVQDESDPVRIRSVEMQAEIPPELDKDIWGGNRGMAIPASFQKCGLRSHVLLSACGAKEVAREARGRGYFTMSLLDTLERVGADKVTYVDLFQQIACPLSQNPQCEGVNQGRVCFNSKVPVRVGLMYPVHRNKVNQKYIMDAGTIHGITDGALFSLYNDRSLVATQPPLATLKASNPSAFSTNLILVSEWSEFPISEPAFALLIRAGKQEHLRVHVEPDEKVARELVDEMQMDDSEKLKPVLVEKEMAEVEIAFDGNRIVFNILDPLVTIHGLNRIPFSVPPTPGAIAPVIGKAAHYFWHLRRTGSAKAIQDNVQIEFTRLEEAEEEYEDESNRVRKPCGENLIDNGVIVVEEDAIYGMKITNKWNKPLYPSLFYFDNSNFSITSYFQPTTSPGIVDPPLLRDGSVTIGYGSGGGGPFEYTLRKGQDVDVGFLKLFISTEPVDLSGITQLPLFEGSRGMQTRNRGPAGTWSTLLFTVVQRRPST